MPFPLHDPLIVKDFRVFFQGDEVKGVIDVTPPQIKFGEAEIAGGGISGKVNVITDDTEELSLKLKFRGVTEGILALTAPGKVREVELRSATLLQDPSSGEEKEVSYVVSLMCKPKQHLGGTVAKSTTMENEVEFAVYRYVSFFNGVEQLEVQPLAGVVKFQGEDIRAQTLALIS